MKLFVLSTAYPEYIRQFYIKRPEAAGKGYAQQKAVLDYDSFGWADFWTHALHSLGYDTMQVTANVEPLQRAWAAENGMKDSGRLPLNRIAVEQVKRFKPEVLWFDDSNESLLKEIRSEVPSIRLVLGWVGSALSQTGVWRQIDLILSCAPESVERLRQAGFRAEHLHHAFEPRIIERLAERPASIGLSFIGQIIRGSQFHLEREHILEELLVELELQIFSPSADITLLQEIKAVIRQLVYSGMSSAKAVGIPEELLRKLPKLGAAAGWKERPLRPVNPKLKPHIKPPVFGLEMYQIIKDSKMTLNIHADSSPTFASNMRLYETTGVGTCLITDWRQNIGELFEPDKEIITYSCPEECIEKVRYLTNHPGQLRDIAKAGQARTMKEHTFAHRAVQVDEIISRRLRS